ncbi:protein of unknown function [Tepidibacter aestuarii]|nr:protein of unknown function [Tepidibacter aestuarii]
MSQCVAIRRILYNKILLKLLGKYNVNFCISREICLKGE